jgi:hypothetical protein
MKKASRYHSPKSIACSEARSGVAPVYQQDGMIIRERVPFSAEDWGQHEQ